MSTFKLTKEQSDSYAEKLERKRERVLKGIGFFKLNKVNCEKYFNVVNETFHSPSCQVVKDLGDEVQVKAVFFGSGIVSHPVRYGIIPKYLVQVEPSLLYLLSVAFFNWFKSLFK